MALFPFSYYSNRRPHVLFCFFFSYYYHHFFCPKTLQPILTKPTDRCHDKIWKKHTSCFLVLTSGPEIIKINVFLKSVNERAFKFLVMVKIFQPQCPFQTSSVTSGCHQKKNEELNFNLFFDFKYISVIFR